MSETQQSGGEQHCGLAYGRCRAQKPVSETQRSEVERHCGLAGVAGCQRYPFGTDRGGAKMPVSKMDLSVQPPNSVDTGSKNNLEVIQ
ncbi:MAG: hypothetical protein K2N01_10860 [Lachnospiraceae bacterium]|nr:hypothetical protein [Lachnospiraceae bacterium]